MSKAAKATKTGSRIAGLGVIMVIVALVALMTVPALAHHKDGHEQGNDKESSSQSSGSDHDGDADSDEDTQYTEDNDTNDGNTPNNVEDDGDNAHPSGKDRSVENGGSGNQGKSESDPDDDGRGPDRTNGGPDKPNGSGGVDAADQDGNNGCGNDDDFEDDNEGWCGGKPKPANTTEVKPKDEVKPDVIERKVCPAGTDKAGQAMTSLKDCDEDDVLGSTDESNPKVKRPDTVLGSVIQRSGPEVASEAIAPAAAVLPFTGADLTIFAGVAVGLILLGTFALRVRRES
jgi:hypothetical protein